MVQNKNRLTETFLNSLDTKTPRKYADGGGLYIKVTPTGNKLWQMAYRYNGKQKVLSFGPYPDVSILNARMQREEAKIMLAHNQDPGQEKKVYKRAADLDAQLMVLESMRDVRAFMQKEFNKMRKAKEVLEKGIKDLDKQIKDIEEYLLKLTQTSY